MIITIWRSMSVRANWGLLQRLETNLFVKKRLLLTHLRGFVCFVQGGGVFVLKTDFKYVEIENRSLYTKSGISKRVKIVERRNSID